MAAHIPLPKEPPERQAAARRCTWVSVWVNLLLTGFQLVVGVFAH